MTLPSLKDRIQFAYEGGLVERFHTRPGLRRNPTAQHQHGVAMLCYWLAEEHPSAALLMSALTHDTAEQVVGDVPAPTKWALKLGDRLDRIEQDALSSYGLEFALAESERHKLRLADALDGLLYCSTELTLGNRRVLLTGARWAARIAESKKACITSEWDVVQAVLVIWKEAVDGKEPQRFDL